MLAGARRQERLGRTATAFAISRSEVTFGQWKACADDGGCRGYLPFMPSFARLSDPVTGVSWSDAESYVRWLKKKTGQPYRLVTQNEWEYAANLTFKKANFGAGSSASHRPQGAKLGLSFGSPKLFEWVQDCWRHGEMSLASDSPQGYSGNTPSGRCEERVLFGSLETDRDAGVGTLFARFGDSSESREDDYTFRVARGL
jgi:formylglycine-generating enzyme required for sulfatase activity